MGWEVRLFFRPLAGTGTDLVHDCLRGAAVEERTDLYHPHSAALGLKARGGRAIELKVREQIDENGFEKWSKHHASDLADAGSMVRSLEEAGCVPPTSSPAAAAPPVAVHKKRRQHWCDGALVEQTELTLSAGGGGASPPSEVWRTVAVEGKRKQALPVFRELRARCASHAEGGAVLQFGYPAFVLARAAEWALVQVNVPGSVRGDAHGAQGTTEASGKGAGASIAPSGTAVSE